jgi:hypothetical protein
MRYRWCSEKIKSENSLFAVTLKKYEDTYSHNHEIRQIKQCRKTDNLNYWIHFPNTIKRTELPECEKKKKRTNKGEHHAIKAYRGSGGIPPWILNLGPRWMWVVSFTPRSLYTQGKNPLYSLDRRLGGPQSRSGHDGEQKNSQPLPGLQPWHHASSPPLYH